MTGVGVRGEPVSADPHAWVDALVLGLPLLALFVGFAVVLWVDDHRRRR
ncbi:hypothetical protein CLV30_102139 [Haloactinopolyspora alba]|uniref:Uncharacterized protein n=1 Tax=Haloactinopolyspora alba TaxID=648780 RepID=A0A2P8EBC0_9ACTN|nr:hypothetical protein CLV30_102139 [Haloactinopolyspora alba]